MRLDVQYCRFTSNNKRNDQENMEGGDEKANYGPIYNNISKIEIHTVNTNDTIICYKLIYWCE